MRRPPRDPQRRFVSWFWLALAAMALGFGCGSPQQAAPHPPLASTSSDHAAPHAPLASTSCDHEPVEALTALSATLCPITLALAQLHSEGLRTGTPPDRCDWWPVFEDRALRSSDWQCRGVYCVAAPFEYALPTMTSPVTVGVVVRTTRNLDTYIVWSDTPFELDQILGTEARAPATDTTLLTVRSCPEGVVFLDGRYVGLAPVSTLSTSGTHTLEVQWREWPGGAWRAWTATPFVRPGESNELTRVLP